MSTLIVSTQDLRMKALGTDKVNPGTPFLEETLRKLGIISAPCTELGKANEVYSTFAAN
jgi:hypothetical protein